MSEEKLAKTAAPTDANTPVEATPVATKTEPAKPAVSKPAAVKPAAKPSRLEETKAKNKKALADALAKAQAVKLARPPVLGPATSAKVAKPAKGKKPKLVRHAFSMPEVEYAQIAALKKRIASLGGNVKRSELLRAGIALLSVFDDVELTTVMARVDRIKTGRPAKK